MTTLRTLIIEDSEKDAILLLAELKKAGYSPVHQRVDTKDGLEKALTGHEWDLVLCDYVMPSFSGPAALKILRQKNVDIPFIVVSGQIGEDIAVEAMKAGAHDYVMKGNLKRLGPAIKRELAEAESRHLRRLAERDLREREDELYLARKTEQLKDEFIGMVSHELKTPLTVIIGALSTATIKSLPREDVKKLLQDAVIEADALARIVDNLLELSRYQSKRLTLKTQRIDIGPIIRSVLQKVKLSSDIHRFTTDISPGLPAAAIDQTRIELVLHNLLENAIKYSPQGGEVKTFAHPQNDHLVVGVIDQGTGITTEDQGKLFQDFQRLGAENKPGIPGVGLGLKVCRILVETHGGRIWVDSEPGRGSTFCFTLPTVDGHSQ